MKAAWLIRHEEFGIRVLVAERSETPCTAADGHGSRFRSHSRPGRGRSGSLPTSIKRHRKIHHSTSSRLQAAASGFQRTEIDDLPALVDDGVARAGFLRVDAVQAHAQAVLDHRHCVVTKPAERSQIVLGLVSAGPAVRDVLNGRGGRLAEDAEAMVGLRRSGRRLRYSVFP